MQVLLAADDDVMKSSKVSCTDAWAAMEAASATTGATPALQFFTCANRQVHRAWWEKCFEVIRFTSVNCTLLRLAEKTVQQTLRLHSVLRA